MDGYLKNEALVRVCVYQFFQAITELHVQVFQYIHTGPMSALNPSAPLPGRKNNANIMGLKEVTPRSIAYACVIVSYIQCVLHCLLNL